MTSRVLAIFVLTLNIWTLSASDARAYGNFRFGIGFNFGFGHGGGNYGQSYGPTYYNSYNYYVSPYFYIPYYSAPPVVYAPPPLVVVPPPSSVVPAVNYVQRATYILPSPSNVQPQAFSLPIPAVSNQPATIVVRLADPFAQIYFDDTLTQQTGAERRFHTPPLTFSASNTYTIRAVSPQSGGVQSQRVRVTPGQTVVVDFTRGNSEGVPAPR